MVVRDVRVDLLHLPPRRPVESARRDQHARDASAGQVGHVLDVVQEGHVVVVRSEQHETAVELDEAIEDRAAAEREVPRLPVEQVLRSRTADGETGDVIIDGRTGPRAEELGEHAVILRGAGRERIEGREVGEHLGLFGRCQVASPHLVVVAGAADVHHQGSRAGHGVLERQVDLVGSADHRADGPDRRVQHDDVAGPEAEPFEVAGERVPGVHERMLPRLAAGTRTAGWWLLATGWRPADTDTRPESRIDST